METKLDNFMNNITLINKDISKYEDKEKGVLYYLNTIQLIVKVEKLELSAEEYKIKKFEKTIDDLDYDIVEIDRPVPKYSITKKEEDKYVITNSKVKVREIWNVSNAIGIKMSFNNKDDALKYSEEINNQIIKFFE